MCPLPENLQTVQNTLGKIGLVLALEVSRLSRSNRDWYHLLDICAVTLTLIADGEGLYDPRSYNDRLLLGLKATMSEAELHVIKQRLVEAVRSKARRGEFRRRLPTGYIWDQAGRTQITPNDEVVQAIRLVFDRFDQLGGEGLPLGISDQEIACSCRIPRPSDSASSWGTSRSPRSWRRPRRCCGGRPRPDPGRAAAAPAAP